MLDKLLNSNALNINCDIACLIDDREGMLDQYDSVNLNCDTYIASEAVNAKLLGKGANINADSIVITDYKGEFVQLPDGAVIDGGTDYSGVFVIAPGNVLLRSGGIRAFENAAGTVVSGTVYYPDSCSQSALARVQGNRRSYPEGAYVVLGSRGLGRLLAEMPENTGEAWVAGEVSVFDESELQKAKSRGVSITCDRLYTYEGLYEAYRDLFQATDCILVPDGYAVVGAHTLNEASILYGKRLYVRGAFLLEEKAAGCLSQFESILVKGCASLPSSCVQAFQAVGKADSYRLYEGRLYTVNGWETISHERLSTMVERGEKITLHINGFVLFADDVTASDMDAIASLSCNGFIIMPGEAQGAVAARTGSINGFMTDMASVEKMTGLTMQELIQKLAAGKMGAGNINADIYMLL